MVQVIIGGLIQMITQAMVVVALEVEIILVLLPGLQDMGAHKVPVVQVEFTAVGQVEQLVFLVTEERVLQELAAVAAVVVITVAVADRGVEVVVEVHLPRERFC